MNITELQERIEKLEKELIAIKGQHQGCGGYCMQCPHLHYQPCYHWNWYPYNQYVLQGEYQYYSQLPYQSSGVGQTGYIAGTAASNTLNGTYGTNTII